MNFSLNCDLLISDIYKFNMKQFLKTFDTIYSVPSIVDCKNYWNIFFNGSNLINFTTGINHLFILNAMLFWNTYIISYNSFQYIIYMYVETNKTMKFFCFI